jgi:hypothetical protein
MDGGEQLAGPSRAVRPERLAFGVGPEGDRGVTHARGGIGGAAQIQHLHPSTEMSGSRFAGAATRSAVSGDGS